MSEGRKGGMCQHINSFETWCILTDLVETVLSSVRDVDDVDDLCDETGVEEVTEVELGLEVCGSCEDDTLDVDLVVGDKVLDRVLGHLSDVVVSGLHTQSRESERRLSSSSVLLGEIDSKLVENLPRVSRQSSEQLNKTGRATDERQYERGGTEAGGTGD